MIISEILKKILSIDEIVNSNNSKINLFGSILIPSKQFLARFKYRPWKGVYCSQEFLGSVDIAKNLLAKIILIYKKYNICPIIETPVTSQKQFDDVMDLF